MKNKVNPYPNHFTAGAGMLPAPEHFLKGNYYDQTRL